MYSTAAQMIDKKQALLLKRRRAIFTGFTRNLYR